MAQTLQQTTEQRLQQTLSPIQVQYARALEMTGPEFDDEVRRALDENPALEVDPDSPLVPMAVSESGEEGFDESAEQLQRADYGSDDEVPHYRLNISNRSDDDPSYDPATGQTAAVTLLDSLTAQIDETDAPDTVKALARYVAGAIDANGYLTRTTVQMVDDLAFGAGIDVSPDQMRRAVELVRTLDPPGIGASDLRQSLLLQLRRLPDTQRTADSHEILTHYFDLFAKHHFDKLQTATGLDSARMSAALEMIRSLNPKPGAAFESMVGEGRMDSIVPDFEVEVDHDGSRVVVSMPTTVPRLRVAESFEVADTSPQLRRRARQQDEQMLFVRRKRDEATDFIRAAAMRRDTLMRVMQAIVKLQREFFVSGGDPLKLRPMILKDVSALTGDDMSVVSRATAGKYVQASSGIYPLKYFFNERPRDDLDASAHELLDLLRAEIEAEDRRRPLSDQALTERLAAKGYDIARRTVTKYRERLGLPVARLRREL